MWGLCLGILELFNYMLHWFPFVLSLTCAVVVEVKSVCGTQFRLTSMLVAVLVPLLDGQGKLNYLSV